MKIKKIRSPVQKSVEVDEVSKILHKGDKGEPDRVTCSLGARIKFGEYNNREISMFYSLGSDVRYKESVQEAFNRIERSVENAVKKQIDNTKIKFKEK